MNPLAQLFALIVEQLPGCLAPGGNWAKASEADREIAATDYLFRDALAACDKTATSRTMAHMFGANAVTATTAISPAQSQKPVAERTRSKVETKVKVQTTLTMQRLLLNALEKKKPDTKAADM